jgi:hypothetical protein
MEAVSYGGGRRRGERQRGELTGEVGGEARASEVSDARCSAILSHAWRPTQRWVVARWAASPDKRARRQPQRY